MTQIEQLRDAIAASAVLTDPQVGDGFVFGKAHLSAANVDVNVNVDPELEDQVDIDADMLIAAIEQVLEMPTEAWRQIVDGIAEEVEDAVGDQEVIEKTDLRDDLSICSVVIFADAILLSFAAPKQFPDSWIRAQLGVALEVEGVSVDEKDGIETVEFDTLENLLDHLTSDDGSDEIANTHNNGS
ncbi:hypothetical protein ACIPPQ_19620 [Sphingopyxis sp. LARHCG72]